MIKTKLFDRRSLCHVLIYSPSNPEVIFPVKAVIQDIHFDPNIPSYTVKIIKFYDNIIFLRNHFYNHSFLVKYKTKPKKFNIPKKKTVAELETWFNEESNILFCVNSTMVFRTKIEMMEMFNKIQEYLIIKNLRAIRDSINRPAYNGELRIESKIEFNERLKRMFSDKFSTIEDFEKFTEYI